MFPCRVCIARRVLSSWKGKKLPKKRENGSLVVLCREQGTCGAHPAGSREVKKEQGKQSRSRGSKEGAGKLCPCCHLPPACPGRCCCSQVLPVLPAESGQLPALPSKASPAWAAPGTGWQLLGQLGWETQHSPGRLDGETPKPESLEFSVISNTGPTK